MSTMTESNSETYNGWANRETWAFNLHWQNDHGLYLAVLDHARGVIDTWGLMGHTSPAGPLFVGENVRDFIADELPDMSPELWELMRSDVGSFWRVDCEEVGRAVLESLDNES